MVTLKAHILPHHDLQPPGCRGSTGVVRCDQPRTIDMKARGGKRLERVPETIMNEVLGRLSTILT